MAKRGYTNTVLTAIALLLGGVVLGQFAQSGSPALSSAGASGPPTKGGGFVSPAEQRITMINELRALGRKVDSLQARLDKGFSVKVTEMPPVRVQESKSKK